MAKIAIIGSGFSGLSAAAYLSAAGHQVEVFEKNDTAGGRARQFRSENGYLFDMGPSWYWMPGVFERFFNDFRCSTKDFYELKLLDPSFEIVFGERDRMAIPADFDRLRDLVESIEKGAGLRLEKFMQEARFKYEVGMQNLAYQPGISLSEFANRDFVKGAWRLQVFSSFSRYVRKFFSDPTLVALMEFPVLFLGAMPKDTPALYSLMNYAGMKLGTWYPTGGFGKVIDGMLRIAELNGAHFHFNSPVERVVVLNGKASAIMIHGKPVACDAIVAAADYHHVEAELLPPRYRNYSETYWDKKQLAPSCLIFYIGLTRKTNLRHHTLFFDEDLLQHSIEIFKRPQWPSKPLFYVCCPSASDPGVAPPGHENLFVLMPLAPGLRDDEMLRDQYFGIIMDRLEKYTGTPLRAYIDYKKSYCINDFISDYNSYKGNAYGLANTLLQTAFLKPKIRNRKIANLVYAGQLTVPGPGVPPSIISGKIAAGQLQKYFKKREHEVAI